MARCIIAIYFLALALNQSIVFAQSQPAQQTQAKDLDFFNKDFAKTIKSPDQDPQKIIPDQNNFKSIETQETPILQESQNSVMDQTQALAILSVSAILSSKEPEHLFAKLKEFTDTVFEYKLKPDKIYVVGFINRITDAPLDWAKISIKGGQIAIVDQVPEKYPVKLSPSWIIETKKGEILIEGEQKLSNYMNAKGEFLQKYLNE